MTLTGTVVEKLGRDLLADPVPRAHLKTPGVYTHRVRRHAGRNAKSRTPATTARVAPSVKRRAYSPPRRHCDAHQPEAQS